MARECECASSKVARLRQALDNELSETKVDWDRQNDMALTTARNIVALCRKQEYSRLGTACTQMQDDA